jgi:hypothetical protein
MPETFYIPIKNTQLRQQKTLIPKWGAFQQVTDGLNWKNSLRKKSCKREWKHAGGGERKEKKKKLQAIPEDRVKFSDSTRTYKT